MFTYMHASDKNEASAEKHLKLNFMCQGTVDRELFNVCSTKRVLEFVSTVGNRRKWAKNIHLITFIRSDINQYHRYSNYKVIKSTFTWIILFVEIVIKNFLLITDDTSNEIFVSLPIYKPSVN